MVLGKLDSHMQKNVMCQLYLNKTIIYNQIFLSSSTRTQGLPCRNLDHNPLAGSLNSPSAYIPRVSISCKLSPLLIHPLDHSWVVRTLALIKVILISSCFSSSLWPLRQWFSNSVVSRPLYNPKYDWGSQRAFVDVGCICRYLSSWKLKQKMFLLFIYDFI